MTFTLQAHLMALTTLLHEKGLVAISEVIEEIEEIGVTHYVDFAGSAEEEFVDLLADLRQHAEALGAFRAREG